MDKKKIQMVSLFCGAGGLDMGFENQGFQTVWANDFDKDACETHREWSSAEVVQGDIGKVDFSSIPKTDLIAGGFPCQGFSLAGPRKLDDSRNILYRYFVKLVEKKTTESFCCRRKRIMNYFDYNGKNYPFKTIYFQSVENEYIIATEELEHDLLPDSESYNSEEAKLIDEQIFFFVPDNIFRQSEQIIEKYVNEAL